MARVPQRIAPSRARLQRLLSRGYFPSELPPPFTTVDFARHSVQFATQWVGRDIRSYWSRAETYSVPRYGHSRRSLSIVNPVNQLHVCDLIANNWAFIRRRLRRSDISEFSPRISLRGNGRAVTGVDFDAVSERKAEILSSYGRYVKTDVVRFYPSVYTHSIAWALLGKQYCKDNHRSRQYQRSFAALLDKAVAAGQEGQTSGIPIGPDTSRIISELIAVEVEELLKVEIPSLNDRAVRYVDDMIIGLEETEAPSSVLSPLSQALFEYELELSGEKTSVHGIGCPHSPEWINYIRTFNISARRERQRDDLNSFFEQALHLSDANYRENVLLYAVKRAASFSVDVANIPHLVRWLLYCSRRETRCLSVVAEFLAAYPDQAALPTQEVERFILQQIPIRTRSVQTDEIAWLLFWSREIGLRLPAQLITNLVPLRSSALALLSLDIRARGLVDGRANLGRWKAHATDDGLRSEMWLLAYEATRKGWWRGRQSTSFIENHQFFGDIWRAEIEFYDPRRRARRRISPSAFGRMTINNQLALGLDYPT